MGKVPLDSANTEGIVYVACSTLCFDGYPFEDALRTIAELEFHKIDVAIHESGHHLKPSQVAEDVSTAAARLRMASGLVPAAMSVEIDAPDGEEFDRQFRAVCRLARVSMVPLLTLSAALSGTPLDHEVQRLTRLLRLAEKDGLLLTVATRSGTLTEDPDMAVTLCQRVPGLGLTLDPSHYIAGSPQVKTFDQVYPYVRHVHLRDTGRGPNQFQVHVGQGEIEYGRVIAQLSRCHYDRLLTVDIRDMAQPSFPKEHEVRKLKYLLESLV
ncbi:MAG TPA: sugar phosphate isomerase/epimerase [Gemmataceae bacterium]|nr:sugar phosphate isomerase/epimerase [Gemmataceae bacterium]